MYIPLTHGPPPTIQTPYPVIPYFRKNSQPPKNTNVQQKKVNEMQEGRKKKTEHADNKKQKKRTQREKALIPAIV